MSFLGFCLIMIIINVQAFWYLRSQPTLCSSCTTTKVLLAKETSSLPLAPPPSSSFSDPDASEELSFPLARPNDPPLPYDRPQPPSAPPPPSPPPPDSNLASLVSAHTRSHGAPNDEASLLCPLREVAGAEGIVRMHVPFSLSDLSAIEKRLGSFSTNPTAYTEEFRYLTQAYDLTWHDTFVILSSTLTPDECDRIFTAAREHANQVHLTDNQMPVGAAAVPEADPNWDYQDGRDGRRRRDQMLRCLLVGMQNAAQKVVNYDKGNNSGI
ncbi:uncharacterized protein LOC135273982 [Aotus nancymaae]|uniref:uncharacterized protein LOC135273982 n=1 Tax=Aotus nancymaae TaxID=37293 RepID=UPI0030FE360B